MWFPFTDLKLRKLEYELAFTNNNQGHSSSQFPVESVTDYAVRLEKAFAEIRDNYPEQLGMVDKTKHLRERFY